MRVIIEDLWRDNTHAVTLVVIKLQTGKPLQACELTLFLAVVDESIHFAQIII